MRSVALPFTSDPDELLTRAFLEIANRPYYLSLSDNDILVRFCRCLALRAKYHEPFDVMLEVSPYINGRAILGGHTHHFHEFKRDAVSISTTALQRLPAFACASILAHEVGYLAYGIKGKDYHEAEYKADAFADTHLPRRLLLRTLAHTAKGCEWSKDGDKHPSIAARARSLMRCMDRERAF